MESIASQVTAPYRLVAPGQGNFADEPALALESILLSYGLSRASVFVEGLKGWAKGNLFDLLRLLGTLDVGGISQISAALLICYGQDRESVLVELQNNLTPEALSNMVLPLVGAVEQKTINTLTAYLGYDPIAPERVMEFSYLLSWVIQQEPLLEEEITYLLKQDLLMFVKTSVKRQTRTDVSFYSAASELSSWLARTCAPMAFSSNELQDTYFAYVSLFKTSG